MAPVLRVKANKAEENVFMRYKVLTGVKLRRFILVSKTIQQTSKYCQSMEKDANDDECRRDVDKPHGHLCRLSFSERNTTFLPVFLNEQTRPGTQAETVQTTGFSVTKTRKFFVKKKKSGMT